MLILIQKNILDFESRPFLKKKEKKIILLKFENTPILFSEICGNMYYVFLSVLIIYLNEGFGLKSKIDMLVVLRPTTSVEIVQIN